MQKAFSLVELSSRVSGRLKAERAGTQGFSLVELSIVLVILGLLTGGILAGQNLIRAAELRSVSTQFNQYMSAVHTFRDKYFAIPGDMRNATSFWGKDNAACSTDTGTAATPGTCNGDGDGRMDTAGATNATDERFQFWKQLALAGLIEGNYSGLTGTGGTSHAVPGENAPPTKISSGGWTQINWGNTIGNSSLFDGVYNNVLIVGTSNTVAETFGPIFTPEEAWNIDTKMDDGRPAVGTIVVRQRVNCTDATTATADSDNFDSEYNYSNNSKQCSLIFKDLF